LGFAFFLKASAQGIQLSNLKYKKIAVLSDTIKIDSLSLETCAVIIKNVDTTTYFIDYINSQLIWKTKPSIDSVEIIYRVLPFSFLKKQFHKDIQRLETNFFINPYYYDENEANKNQPFVDFGNVDYAGSFGRALSFGNSQDVVLNSQFNLQLEGDLGDSIKLTGAITDNTIPFQPEGNTQQIQEFDRIFLQLSKKKAQLIAGDFDIKKPAGYFMNFYKRVQGGYVSNAYKTGKSGENKIAIGTSLAKGKFVRKVLVSLEGNQGPYKLTGPNGEQFFVVLAGTERVYIDGVQLKRGEEMDYVIDYNSAEIKFMPKRMITKDLRIVVEFEFSDKNYLNSLFYFNDEWQINKKIQVRLNAYSNQDAKNQPIQQSLDTSQKRFLALLGDSIQRAYYPSARLQDTFSNSKILYKKTDTVVTSVLYNNIYVFSTNPDSAKYSLSFTNVGIGNGNYRQSINSANGRVYEWVAPLNNIKQGDYEPILVLITPKKQQLITLGTSIMIDSNKNLMIESALSNYDPNTFSTINNETHLGTAFKIIYDEKRDLNKKKWALFSKLNYEFVQDRFKPLERFRNVEFARDWNVSPTAHSENEHLSNISFSLIKSNVTKIEYQFGTYLRGNSFKGFQQVASCFYNKNGLRFLANGNLITQSSFEMNAAFFRPVIEIEKKFKALNNSILGSKYILEHNDLRSANKDSLLPNAFSFDALTAYIKSNSESKNNYSFEYTLRQDRARKENQFKQSTLGQTFSLLTNIASINNHDIKFVGAYRSLQISDSTITVLKPDESLLGRLEYNFSFFKNVLTGNVLYELGSGQELKREYTYIEVPVGQGLYVWRDYNNDNLKQLNEFELAVFPDEKRYIRIFTPTNQYVKAKYAQYNQSISINPKNLFSVVNKSRLKNIASAIYLQSTIQLNNRFIGTQGLEQFNPLVRNFSDSLLINNASTIVNSFFVNRFNNKWGVDYIQSIISGKTLLNYGIDGRKNIDHQLRMRVNIKQYFTLGCTLKKGSKIVGSQFLESRNYKIENQNMEPNITLLLFKNQLRFLASYKYDIRKNGISFGGEKSKSDNINFELKYNIVSSGNMNIKTTYSSISYNGMSNSTIGYVMLDGLQKGNNWLWQVGFEKRISKNIEMSLQYEGRKPASTNTIHTGRASVRAIF